MNEYLFTLDRIRVVLPSGKSLFEDVRLSFIEGAKIGIVGGNGSGKSTLMRIIAGDAKDYSGEVYRRDGLTVGFLEQEPEFDAARTVESIVNEGFGEKKAVLDRFNEVSNRLGEVEDTDEMMQLIDEQGQLQETIDAENLWDLDSRLDMAMQALGCPTGDALFGEISGGERRRVALCRLLLQQPDVLLLDEPTNHLDAQTVAWLENHLQNYPGAVIMVTHDRSFLDNITEWILELERGQAIPFKGNYRAWLTSKIRAVEQSGKQTSIFHEIAAENAWLNIRKANKVFGQREKSD
ncbi:MAG: ATP-binding cassette domain-containing protein, partial [Actinomycetia bacterium]|nr:ATP-binding cassette domain-containing protein [Actinomycetes bacterium]